MTEFPPEIEQQLAGLDEGEWSAFVAKVRPPDTTEAFRSAAAKHISGDQLDALVNAADVSAFTGADGQIDEAKLARNLGALLGSGQQQQQRNWGQTSGAQGPGLKPGDRGRIEAAKRFGGRMDPEIGAAAGAFDGPGAGGRAEAAKRFGKGK